MIDLDTKREVCIIANRVDAAIHVGYAVAAHLNYEERELVLDHKAHEEHFDHKEHLHWTPAQREAHHDTHDEQRDAALRPHRAPRDGHAAAQQTRDHHAVEHTEE